MPFCDKFVLIFPIHKHTYMQTHMPFRHFLHHKKHLYVPFNIPTDDIEQETNLSPLSTPSAVPKTVKQHKNRRTKLEAMVRQTIVESIEEMGPEVFHW